MRFVILVAGLGDKIAVAIQNNISVKKFHLLYYCDY